jgi:hypothetical protein
MKITKLIIFIALWSLCLSGCGQKGLLVQESKSPNPTGLRQLLTVGPAKVNVEVRNTPSGRELGLSYRQTLGKDEGILFVFETTAPYGFWMKGMAFPLDLVWISEGKVVQLSEQVPAPKAGEEPVVVRPKKMVDQVLEVNAGWVAKQGVRVGDGISF